MASKTDVVKVTGNVAEATPYVPGTETWEDTTAVIAGHDLAKDALLDALVGIPFKITRVVYRKSDYARHGVDYDPAMVSVECVIAPEHVLKRRRVNMAELPFEPESQVVFNDSGAGIYRQVTGFLDAAGLITLPPGEETGSVGQTRYDLPPAKWAEVHGGTITYDSDGFAEYAANVRLTCPRGLRLSEGYENEFTKDGKTRYIA